MPPVVTVGALFGYLHPEDPAGGLGQRSDGRDPGQLLELLNNDADVA